MYLEYRVEEIRKDSKWMGVTMDAKGLEKVINKVADEGWTLDRIVSGETASMMGMSSKDVFLLIFKRERPADYKPAPPPTGLAAINAAFDG